MSEPSTHGQRVVSQAAKGLIESTTKTNRNLGAILRAMAHTDIDSAIDSEREPAEILELSERIKAILTKLSPEEIHTLKVDLLFFGAGITLLASAVDSCHQEMLRMNIRMN